MGECKGLEALGYYSALDAPVQPTGATIPEPYDGTKPTRLYVWLIEDAFLESFLLVGPTGKPWNKTANKVAKSRTTQLLALRFVSEPLAPQENHANLEIVRNTA